MLHDQVADRIGGRAGCRRRAHLTDIVNRADVCVVECSNGPSFALESSPPIRVAGKLCGEDLDGDRAIEPRVERPIDLAHAARTNQADDFIGPEAVARCQGHMSDVAIIWWPSNRWLLTLSPHERLPIQEDARRPCRAVINDRMHQESLTVTSHCIVRREMAGVRQVRFEEASRSAGVEGVARRDWHGHKSSVCSDEEELVAVASPSGLAAATH